MSKGVATYEINSKGHAPQIPDLKNIDEIFISRMDDNHYKISVLENREFKEIDGLKTTKEVMDYLSNLMQTNGHPNLLHSQ